MILVQDTFQAKYGHGDELVALFKEMMAATPNAVNFRIMTDASGPFFQVVTQMEVENFAAWEGWFQEEMQRGDFGGWFGRMVEITESGRRDFYNIVS